MPSHPDRVRENYERRVYADKVQDHATVPVNLGVLSDRELSTRIADAKQRFNIYLAESIRRLRAKA